MNASRRRPESYTRERGITECRDDKIPVMKQPLGGPISLDAPASGNVRSYTKGNLTHSLRSRKRTPRISGGQNQWPAHLNKPSRIPHVSYLFPTRNRSLIREPHNQDMHTNNCAADKSLRVSFMYFFLLSYELIP